MTTRALLAAFEGWNDAADAATGAIEHLETEWQAQPFGAIDPEDYYDYQVNRPTVRLVDGVTRRIEWPTTRHLGRRRRRPARSCCSAASSPTCAGGRSATSWSSSRTSSTSTPSSALPRCWPTSRTPGRSTYTARRPTRRLAASARPDQVALRRPDRHRVGLPRGLPPRRAEGRDVLGVGAALRRAAAVPEGDVVAAAPRGGRARHRDPARRPAGAGAGAGSTASTSWPARMARSPSTSSRSSSARTRPSCRRRRGDAIAKAFERYLRRRDNPPRGR